jgi:ferredoxin--NADP+ reductase
MPTYNRLMGERAVSIEQDVCNAVLISREDFASELSIVRIRPDCGRVPGFVPGQFVKLGLPRIAEGLAALNRPGRPHPGPRLVRRAYSIASSPRQREYMEFLVVRIETGKLTPRLWTMDVGSRIWMDEQVSGRFTLDAIPPGKDIVMVATGTGVAPFVSMLRTYADRPPWRRVVLINGVRYAADLSYRAELESLGRTYANIHYIPIVSREPEYPAWEGLRGRVQKVLEPDVYRSLIGRPLDPYLCHVMLCGNPAMIVSVQSDLEHRGFHTHSPAQPENIHFERYW